ncbi:MAG: cell division protein ZapA [Spirochaetes bacterium]|nr:cell division protein ZapA [Spirochaetota bacterium]
MAIQTMRIDVLGTSFTIQTDESREYMDEVIASLQGRIETVRRETRVADPLKAAILAGVYLVDELMRERGKAAVPESAEMERIARSLIARIDEGLEPDIS